MYTIETFIVVKQNVVEKHYPNNSAICTCDSVISM